MVGYKLIDSGLNAKLEQYGEKILSRPSSVCVWGRRLSAAEWEGASAVYEPKEGWRFPGGEKFTEWTVTIGGVKLLLELQSNGQIGIFPEHSLYVPSLVEDITKLKAAGCAEPNVLNLFAYTGMATVAAAMAGAAVTHIDSSKRALTWARKNLELNDCGGKSVRLIPEDVSKYLEREKRRGNRYDIVVVDPPSFSRVSRDVSWTLEDFVLELYEACRDVLVAERGALYFTNHSSYYMNEVIRNLVLDTFGSKQVSVATAPLLVREVNTERAMPAGSLVHARWGI
jgi:23S rRNA (cytosine1962-C5)-methyltransferase